LNKEEVKKIIEELRSNREVLNELEVKAKAYRNGIDHDLDGNILYELELLQEKLTIILYNFYLGDIEKDLRDRRITLEERNNLMLSDESRYSSESPPFFNFGYMNSDFLATLRPLD